MVWNTSATLSAHITQPTPDNTKIFRFTFASRSCTSASAGSFFFASPDAHRDWFGHPLQEKLFPACSPRHCRVFWQNMTEGVFPPVASLVIQAIVVASRLCVHLRKTDKTERKLSLPWRPLGHSYHRNIIAWAKAMGIQGCTQEYETRWKMKETRKKKSWSEEQPETRKRMK